MIQGRLAWGKNTINCLLQNLDFSIKLYDCLYNNYETVNDNVTKTSSMTMSLT
jgi:hypothetical protein